MARIWPFSGGLRLESHKGLSGSLPPVDAGVPARLIVPLVQRDGLDAEPVVVRGEHVAKGQLIARSDDSWCPPIHAPSSGVVAAIEVLPQLSDAVGRAIVLDTDGADRSVMMPVLGDYSVLPAELLRTRIFEAGIVGLGGAGFPTAAKLSTTKAIELLVLNGAECEPYISCDDALMRHRPHEVLEGATILLRVLDAGRCLIAVEEDKPDAIAALRNLQQQGGYRAIDIVAIPVVYPVGSERQLVQVLTGKEVPPRGWPPDVGIVCHNVGTAAAAFRAVVRGEPLISRIVTVTGRGVRWPRNLEVRIGTPITHLIAQCGGYTPDAERLILGGPMMGRSLPHDDVPIPKTANCVLVAAAGELPAKGDSRPCIRCGHCAEVCPAGLLPQQMHWYTRANKLQRTEAYRLFDCIECGCCDLVCPSHIPLTEQFRTAKGKILARRSEQAQADRARARYEARQARLQMERQQREEESSRNRAALARPDTSEIAAALARARARKRATISATPAESGMRREADADPGEPIGPPSVAQETKEPS